MFDPYLDSLIIVPWLQIGKERIEAVLEDLLNLSGSDMLGNQWPKESDVEQMREFLSAHQSMALVDSKTGHIYGGFGLRYDPHFTCWFYYYLFSLARKQGLGKVLLAHVETIAFQEEKCLTISAHCAPGNLPSIKALRQAGFAVLQSTDSCELELLFLKTRLSVN